jgi:hypothetical protein
LSQIQRPHLVAEQSQHRRRGTDERESRLRAALGEVSVLGQEAVSGVNAVASGCRRHVHERRSVEIGGDGITAGERTGLGDDPGVKRQRVGGRVHPDGLHAQAGGGLGDADGDLAPVGDEHSMKRSHGSPDDRPWQGVLPYGASLSWPLRSCPVLHR